MPAVHDTVDACSRASSNSSTELPQTSGSAIPADRPMSLYSTKNANRRNAVFTGASHRPYLVRRLNVVLSASDNRMRSRAAFWMDSSVSTDRARDMGTADQLHRLALALTR